MVALTPDWPTLSRHLFPLMLLLLLQLLQLLTLQRELSNGFVSTPQFLAEQLHFLDQLLRLRYSGIVFDLFGNWRFSILKLE